MILLLPLNWTESASLLMFDRSLKRKGMAPLQSNSKMQIPKKETQNINCLVEAIFCGWNSEFEVTLCQHLEACLYLSTARPLIVYYHLHHVRKAGNSSDLSQRPSCLKHWKFFPHLRKFNTKILTVCRKIPGDMILTLKGSKVA